MVKFNTMKFISKLFNNKKFVAVFSIICAVAFWLVIDITENPSRDVSISDIPVTITEQMDANGNLLSVIGNYTDKVSVLVTGPGYIVGSVNKDDISVSVSSYSDVTAPGTYALALTASTPKSGCTISKITPSFITVVFDYDTSANIPFEIDTEAVEPFINESCEIHKSSLRTNSEELSVLNVTGPSEVMRSIAKAVIRPVIPTGGIESVTQRLDAEFTFYDTVGNPVDTSELKYVSDAFVAIQVYKTADVALVARFMNLPAYYAASESGQPPFTMTVYNEITKQTEKIEKVTVKGPTDMVEKLINDGLSLTAIDFAEVKPGSTSFDTAFDFTGLDGVVVVDGTESVTVSLMIGSVSKKEIQIDPSKVEFLNVTDGYSASSLLNKKTIKITVTGKYADIASGAFAKSIGVTVDCTGVAGDASAQLTVTIPAKYQAWVNTVDPSEMTVRVSN